MTVLQHTHFNPMARIKFRAETVKKRPRQIIVEADKHHSSIGIIAMLHMKKSNTHNF